MARLHSKSYGRNLYLLLILPAFFLCACPFSSSYKLDEAPSINIDESLLGKWAVLIKTRQDKDEPLKMILTKESDTEYDISFIGQLSDLRRSKEVKQDTIRGTAFLSDVIGRQFLNIDIYGKVYITEVVHQNYKLSLLPISERFTAKYIKSDADLRAMVEYHFKTNLHPAYDEPFCLRDMVRVN